jgi:hypothetical protein
MLLAVQGGWCLIGCGSQAVVDQAAVELEFPDEESGDETPVDSGSEARLQPGERFGFIRRLTTVLTQPGANETVVTRATSQLEFSLVFEGFSIPPKLIETESRIDVRTGDPPARQFQLGFLQCRQVTEFPDGTREVFDSLNSVQAPTRGILGFHGLRGNGFRFWLSERGELLALDDFPGFLDRCSEALPEGAARRRFRRELEETWGGENPVQLLHDWIGLIPVRVQEVGQRWVESRPLSLVERLQSATEYSLVRHEGRQQTVEWAGRQTSRGGPQGDHEMQVRSLGGDWHGSARIETRSRLCSDLLETQQSRMGVRTASGREFTQVRTTTLRIERLPQSQSDSAKPVEWTGTSSKPAATSVSRSGEPSIR